MFSLMPRRARREVALRDPISWFPQEFASLFGRALPAWSAPFETPWETRWGLETDELENEYVVRAEMPGFEASDLEVSLAGNVLTIRAEHRPTAKGVPVEPPYGRLERTMTLPAGANPEGVTALYRNGVLEVHLPKAAAALTRRIEVKT